MTETTETIINILYIILLLGVAAFGARLWWIWEVERRRAKRKWKEGAAERAKKRAKRKKVKEGFDRDFEESKRRSRERLGR